MLVVSRNLDQSVIVGEFDGLELTLKVTVLGVRGKKVRLGFEVLSGDLSQPAVVREPLSSAQPNLSVNPGMATTQEWNLAEDAGDQTDRTPGPSVQNRGNRKPPDDVNSSKFKG
jgi:hypothetical protein